MFVISYQIELRKKDNEYAFITQCYIYKYNAKEYQFQIFHTFLADINTKGKSP